MANPAKLREQARAFEQRGQWREAIDAYRSGSLKDPILRNKTGIAYHQLLQLDPLARGAGGRLALAVRQ